MFKWLLLNIHTILLIVGLGFIALAAFLFSSIFGFLVLGVSCVLLGLVIDKNRY